MEAQKLFFTVKSLRYSLLNVRPAIIYGASLVVGRCFVGEIDNIIITTALCQQLFRKEQSFIKGEWLCGRQSCR